MKSFPELSVVVPAFREASNLQELTERLFAALSSLPLSAELIIVDDNSNDGTEQVCDELAKRFPVRLVTRKNERGLATAVICGLKESCGNFVVVMDADLSHPPESVPALVKALQTGSTDFAIGSRYVEGGAIDESWSVLRLINSRVATLLARGLTRASDPMAGFFAIRRDSIKNLKDLNPCGYKIGLELIVRCNCRRLVEIPIEFADRKHGESKLSFHEQLLYIRHLSRLYAYRFGNIVRFAKFAAVGTSGMLIDLSSFQILLPLGYPAARAVAIHLAMTWNFEINRRFTFPESNDSSYIKRYFKFVAACFAGACLNWILSLSLMSTFNICNRYPVATAALITGLVAIANYTLCRNMVFSSEEKSDSRTPVANNLFTVLRRR